MEALTIVIGQTPASGHTRHASREVIAGLSHADGGNAKVDLGGAGQLDQGDVIVDGVAVVVGVSEHLKGSDIIRDGRLRGRTACRDGFPLTLVGLMVWVLSALEERSCSPRTTRWLVLQMNAKS